MIFLYSSSYEWSRLSSSSLLPSRPVDLTEIQESSFSDKLKMSQFAFEVLEGSIFCLKMHGEDCILLPCILAAIFIIDWECSMSSIMNEDGSESPKDIINAAVSLATSGTVLENHSWDQLDAKSTLGRRIHAFRHGISSSFWKCLSSSSLSILRRILIQTVRSAAFEMNTLISDRISSVCCDWMLDILEVLCHDQAELQSMLDQLLTEDSSWPFWVGPSLQDESRSANIQDRRVDTDITVSSQFMSFCSNYIFWYEVAVA